MTANASGEASAADGLLSIVGTPIGNLADASPRVIDALGSANLLLCEDTRVTSRLLAHFGVHVPLQRADENVISQRIDTTLELLSQGKRVAFVSDAGMPGVSDPGQRLVDAALDAGLRVEVIPGPSAVTCALALSGLPMEHFFFEGFLPRRHSQQLSRLRALASIPGALVVFESPRRVVETLACMAEAFPERRVALVRELTKVHEEVARGISGELAEQMAQREGIRGECVIVIAPPSADELSRLAQEARGGPLPSLEDAVRQALSEREPKSAAAKRLSKLYDRPKSEIYDLLLSLDSTERGNQDSLL